METKKETKRGDNMDKMKTWYFTFGCDHPLAKSVQPIRASSAWHARLKMIDMYGKKWCWQYDEEQFAEVQKKWGPYELLQEAEIDVCEASEIAQRLGVAS